MADTILFNVLHEMGFIAVQTQLDDIKRAVKQDEINNQIEPVTWQEVENEILNLGFDVVQANKVNVVFLYKGHNVIYYMKKKWASGKTITDGRGWKHLINQIKK